MKPQEQIIRKNIHDLADAITNRDFERAGRYYARDYTLVESGQMLGWQDQRKMFQDHIKNHEIDVDFHRVKVSDDETMAWCILNEETSYRLGDENVKQNTIITTIWEKRDGDWKLVHFNRSVDPEQIPEAMKEMSFESA